MLAPGAIADPAHLRGQRVAEINRRLRLGVRDDVEYFPGRVNHLCNVM